MPDLGELRTRSKLASNRWPRDKRRPRRLKGCCYVFLYRYHTACLVQWDCFLFFFSLASTPTHGCKQTWLMLLDKRSYRPEWQPFTESLTVFCMRAEAHMAMTNNLYISLDCKGRRRRTRQLDAFCSVYGNSPKNSYLNFFFAFFFAFFLMYTVLHQWPYPWGLWPPAASKTCRNRCRIYLHNSLKLINTSAI